MTEIIQQRMAADMEGDFVVFLIGLRVNHFWKVHKWLPVARSMGRMLKELHQHPELGFISYEQWVGRTTMMVQYWRSFEQLEAYAKSKTSAHLPAWADFNRRVGSNGDVGIWHETYLSGKGQFECVYNNMPPFGLGKAGNLVPATGQQKTARGRVAKGAPE